MKLRNIGMFRVSREFFEDVFPEQGSNLFHKMIVLEARVDWYRGYTLYTAIHPDFRKVSEGETIPNYKGIFSSDSSYPKWVECDGD